MDHATQVDVITRWLAMHRSGGTQLAPDVLELDTAVYTDPVWFGREREALFGARATVACCSADVREPGDYVTADVGGTPVLIVRDDDGAIAVSFGVAKVPETWVVDANGFVRLRILGAVTADFLTTRISEARNPAEGEP